MSQEYLLLKLVSNRLCEDDAKHLVTGDCSQSRWIKMTGKAAELHAKAQAGERPDGT